MKITSKKLQTKKKSENFCPRVYLELGTLFQHKIHPKNYAHGICFVMFVENLILGDFIHIFNVLRRRLDGSHSADDIFPCLLLNKNIWISINISLKFVPKGPIDNITGLVQIMAWHHSADKPLSEPMISLLMHICNTWPQWVRDHITNIGTSTWLLNGHTPSIALLGISTHYREGRIDRIQLISWLWMTRSHGISPSWYLAILTWIARDSHNKAN